MTERNLTKLQIRAEVLAVIKLLSTIEKSSKDDQAKHINKLKSISDRDSVLECLLRELPKDLEDQQQTIAQLLFELGTIEKLKYPLWNIIKDVKISDEVKDIANLILRNLGDNSDPDLYLSYLSNPEALIDKETEKMLKMASVNPEAQIDFLDFLYSLASHEQINLIDSLKNDYPGEYLIHILIPALDAKPDEEVQNSLIDALGNTKTYEALEYLSSMLENTKKDLQKRIIKKNINILKLSGINNNKLEAKTPEVIRNSDIFQCYASPIDGVGNQGIIISRLIENQDISMFSVVINDSQGILDCFGFNQISHNDFKRIIKKFQEGSQQNPIPAEYCKYKLELAENINKSNNLPIPYEYTAWKVLTLDILPFTNNLDNEILTLFNNTLLDQSEALYSLNDFKCWFFEEDDHPKISNMFESNTNLFISKLNEPNPKTKSIEKLLNNNIMKFIPELFDDNWCKIYYKRLIDCAYLFKQQNLESEAELSATVAYSLSNESTFEVSKNKFILKILQKSSLENLLRFQYKLDENSELAKKLLPDENLEKYKSILNKIYQLWNV